MGKSGVKAGRHSSPATRTRIVEAARRTLREEGFAGTSTRAIAEKGGFNSALIFYYFGGLNDLLLATLEETSTERLRRYAELLGESDSIAEMVVNAKTAFKEDFDSGHVSILAELVGGSSSYPDLRDGLIRQIDPWIELAEEAISRFFGPTPFGILPARQIAYGLVAFFLGIEVLAHLKPEPVDLDEFMAAADPLLTSLQFLAQASNGQ